MAEIVVKLVNGELAGKTAQGLTKEINEAARAASKAEVGTKAWIDAHKKFDGLKKQQSDLKKQIEGTTTASNGLKGAFGGILNQIPGFSAISGALNSAKGGVGGLTSGFGLLKGAIIATGLGALIIVITTLFSWFTKTEKGANMVAGAFKAMGAVVDTLLGKLWNIRDTLKEFMANPLEFFKNLGNDISSAAKEGYELVQVFDDIEDRQRDLSVTSKQNELAIDRMLTQAKNVGKTYEEKVSILKTAEKLIRDNYAAELALSKEYQDAVQREIDGEMKRQGVTEMTGEQHDKLTQAKLAYMEILGREQGLEDKIANFREKIFGQQQKAQEKKNTAAEQDLDDFFKSLEEKHKAELDFTQKQYDELAALEKADKDKIKAADDEFNKQQYDDAVDEFEKRKQLAKDQADYEKALLDARLGLQSTALGVTIQLLGEDEKARKKNAETIKLFTIGQIVTDTQREIAGYYANPASTASLGAVGTYKTLGALLRAGLAIAKVSNQTFEKGGEIKGPRHTGGGVNINAEGGEFMFSRKAVRGIGMANLARMNNYFTYQNGGPVNPFDRSRGPISSGKAAPGGDPFTALARLEQKFEVYADKVDHWATSLQVNNNVQDTEGKMNVLNKLRNEADV